ncbi:MAG: hypothetical protein SH850_21330 [Planctomycetaceae bacterium]|nr:hypothetical protein [Planctomycetaceae bacterium]
MRRCAGILSIVCWLILGSSVAAQPTAKPSAERSRTTVVQVELLTGPDGGAITAQEWRIVFEKLDVELLVRRGVLDDKPEVKEKDVGTLRYVTAIGKLERSGRLVFGDKTFNRDEAPKLKEWLDELKTYGSQGAPTGKPLWGLSKTQFEQLYAAMANPSADEIQNLPLAEAIEQLKLPAAYPLRWSTAARDRLSLLGETNAVRQPLAGFSKATQLAIALNDHGFGYRPNRTPAGNIELVIEPQTAQPTDQWPVGWPLQQQAPQAMPGLFAMTNIELERAVLTELLAAGSDLTGTPMLIDYAELARRQIDPAAVIVKHPFKKTTWSLALRAMLVPQKLNREYWQDEAGRAFVWITVVGKTRANAEH